MIHYWDFFGPRAEGTARHFKRHVEEFISKEFTAQRESFTLEVDRTEDFHWVVTCAVSDDGMSHQIEKILKPRRSR